MTRPINTAVPTARKENVGKYLTHKHLVFAFISLPLPTHHSRGLNTNEKIVSRWAPPNENNTADYIAKVEKYSCIPHNKELAAVDGADYILIVAAMRL